MVWARAVVVRWLWGVGSRSPFNFRRKIEKWPTGRVSTDLLRRELQEPRWQPRHSGGGGREQVVEALPSYLSGRSTAAPVIHSRAVASAVCVIQLTLKSKQTFYE
jgi:hypothetical protein